MKNRSRQFSQFAIWLISVLLAGLYPLSYPLMALAILLRPEYFEVFQAFYAPLFWLCQEVRWFGRLMEWYCNLWGWF